MWWHNISKRSAAQANTPSPGGRMLLCRVKRLGERVAARWVGSLPRPRRWSKASGSSFMPQPQPDPAVSEEAVKIFNAAGEQDQDWGTFVCWRSSPERGGLASAPSPAAATDQSRPVTGQAA